MRCHAVTRLLATVVALIGVMPASGAVIVGDATDAGFTPRLVVTFKADRSARRNGRRTTLRSWRATWESP